MNFLAQVGRDAEELLACGAPEEASTVCQLVFRITGNRHLATVSDTVIVKPAKVIIILLLTWLASRLLRRFIRRVVRGMKGERVRRGLQTLGGIEAQEDAVAPAGLRAAQRADTVGTLVASIGTVAIWAIGVVTMLGEIGITLGPLIAGAGIAGIALGFGAQNLVRDFLSGIFMLVEDQYGVGDVIDAGPATGTVEALTLRTTRLRDVHGVVWHIPNGTIDRVGNKSQQWSRALLDIEVAYDTDLDRASAIIEETCLTMWQEEEWAPVILERPEVWGVEGLGANGVALRLVVKVQPSEQWRTARELRRRIKRAFDDAGIEIPFAQRVVWHRSLDHEPSQMAGHDDR